MEESRTLDPRLKQTTGTQGANGADAESGSTQDLGTDALTWIAQLAAAREAIADELGAMGTARLTEARLLLARVETGLRHAPERIAEVVRTSTSRLRTIGEHEVTEAELTYVNEQLVLQIAGRERLQVEHSLTERGLREVRERFESAFNNAPIGMALVHLDGHCLQVNDALCGITGHSRAQLQTLSLREITHPEDAGLGEAELQAVLADEAPNAQVEKRYRHALGHDVWVLEITSIVRDADRTPLYALTQVQDISERKELARRLEYVVEHDFLTGLLNRKHFEAELARETARAERYGIPGAVMLIDLDNFKTINDTFGHKAGDDVLKGVAGQLRQRLRSTDIIARVGGDEFAVLLTQTDADQVRVVAGEVVRALGREIAMLADQSIRVTASVGVAMFDHHSDVEVLAYADLAMYEAKETGRNRFEMYRQIKGGRERISARFAESERIREALEQDRLILFSQPIVDLASNEICMHELLLRLPDKEGGEPLAPNDFLYRAERSGLIAAIDGWVVRRAIAMLAEHLSQGRRSVLTVNLSGRSIGDPRLAGIIEDALTESGIDPAQLVFELTETAAISNFEDAKAFALRLRARGCRFALDDFGAGFGSFFYLKSFPFEFLKIDGDFIRDLVSSPTNQLVVSAMVSIAQGMGMKTVAEFVPDEETMQLLRTLGVDYAQGYHAGIPRPVAETLRAA